MDKTVEVALYASKYFEFRVNEVATWIEESEEYTRVSEIVEVKIKLLPRENVLKLRLACLDREIQSVRANAAKKIEDIEIKNND